MNVPSRCARCGTKVEASDGAVCFTCRTELEEEFREYDARMDEERGNYDELAQPHPIND